MSDVVTLLVVEGGTGKRRITKKGMSLYKEDWDEMERREKRAKRFSFLRGPVR